MMFRSRHPLRALTGLQRLEHVLGVAHHIRARVPRAVIASLPAVRRRTPSAAHVLLAGAAVLAFVSLLSQASSRRRSRLGRLVFGVLLIVVGALVLSLRRSGRRYRL